VFAPFSAYFWIRMSGRTKQSWQIRHQSPCRTRRAEILAFQRQVGTEPWDYSQLCEIVRDHSGVSAQSAPETWIAIDVPELRIIDDAVVPARPKAQAYSMGLLRKSG
jgi:hypothetical protein